MSQTTVDALPCCQTSPEAKAFYTLLPTVGKSPWIQKMEPYRQHRLTATLEYMGKI